MGLPSAAPAPIALFRPTKPASTNCPLGIPTTYETAPVWGKYTRLIVSSALYNVVMGGSSVGLRWGCSNFLSSADSEDKKWLGEFDKSDTRAPFGQTGVARPVCQLSAPAGITTSSKQKQYVPNDGKTDYREPSGLGPSGSWAPRFARTAIPLFLKPI